MNNNSWGPVTWVLLHTIAAKIKSEYFLSNKVFLINIIKLICKTLPCEDCANHATILLNNYKHFHKLNTLHEFQIWLWEFHNIINIKLGKKEVSKDILQNFHKNNLIQLLQFWNTKYKLNVQTAYQLKHSIDINNTRNIVNTFIYSNKQLFNM